MNPLSLLKRLGLRAKLLVGIFLILGASIGLVASQAVLLFQEDKSSYVFELNASQAIRIADEIQANARHLTEKMRIFSATARLPLPPGPERAAVLVSMLQQYPEFLLLSERVDDGTIHNLSLSRALTGLGLTVEQAHAAWAKAVPFDKVTPDHPFIGRLGLSAKGPTFTLAVRGAAGSDGAPAPVLLAECPIDRLYADRGSRLFDVFVTDAAGKAVAAYGLGAAAAATAGFSDLLPKSAATAGTREYVASGVATLAAFAPVSNLGMWTVVQIPKARAFEAASRLVTRSVILAAIVGFSALVVVFLFASSLTRSLEALTRATQEIGRGQFDIKLPTEGGGEIGALASRFGRMTEELAARETALKEANRRLIESEKMTALGQLGAGIAHEVKNPMTSIRGYAQMGLRKVPQGNPLHEYFATIEKETSRSLEILKNLLKFSRQETAEMSLIDLNGVVTDTLKLVTHQLEMKRVEVQSTLSNEPIQIMGNANQIEQVLLNLCMNAGDAMEKTGGSLMLTTELVDGKLARIRLADTGSGIPPEALNRIFEPFYTTKPVGKGTGLGLSVSYGIVKEHKGEITAQSKIGEGTTFTITIPLARKGAEAPAQAAAGAEKRLRVISLR